MDLGVLCEIFKHQPPGYICLSSKFEGVWKDNFFKTWKEAEKWINDNIQQDGMDLYFCTTTLSKPQRKKQNINPSMYLWADLDPVDPRKIKPRPAIAWESSPNRYQALWKLDQLYEPGDIEFINKALAKEVKADRGSYILTKVLRIPGTTNYKYKDKPQGKLLWSKGPTYSYDQIEEFTSSQELSSEALLSQYYNKIPTKVRNLLVSKQATGDRSGVLWSLEHDLVKAGIPREDIFILVRDSVWNKYKGRSDEEVRLRTEIDKVFEEEVLSHPKEDQQDIIFGQLSIKSDLDLMGGAGSDPGWLVKHFWSKKSHGIVAGEPKSFKSTLVMDLMVSVASGKPFLNDPRYSVEDPGPVLMIQNENADWIMKDRLTKIREGRGLVGRVKMRTRRKYSIIFSPELKIYYINQQGFTLTNPQHKDQLEEMLENIHPKLLILDPLYLMFDGDINSAKELNPALSWLLYLKEKYNMSLILVHHWNKSGSSSRGGQRMLGSTTLHGWIESAWYLQVIQSTEGEEQARVDIPSASSTVVLEREFRGAGAYPLSQLTITMGESGNNEYSVEMDTYIKPTKKSKKEAPSDIQIRKEILNQLNLKADNTMSLEEIVEGVGIDERQAMECCKYLVTRKKLEEVDVEEYKLVRRN